VELSVFLGLEPRVHLDGPIDSAVSDLVAVELLASLRELLTNVGKHAQATSVDVYLRVGSDITLTVVDNGIGPSKAKTGGNGLKNLESRALGLGGEFTLTPGEKGSVATLRVERIPGGARA